MPCRTEAAFEGVTCIGPPAGVLLAVGVGERWGHERTPSPSGRESTDRSTKCVRTVSRDGTHAGR